MYVLVSSVARCTNLIIIFINNLNCEMQSRSAVWQGVQMSKLFLRNLICEMYPNCPGQKCGKVPKCQNCFFPQQIKFVKRNQSFKV